MLTFFAIWTQLFHDGGHYHIEASTLICRANRWTGFYMISASVMKELKRWWLLKLILPYKSNKKHTHEKEHFLTKLCEIFPQLHDYKPGEKLFYFQQFFGRQLFREQTDDFRFFPLRTSLVNVNKSAVFCGFFDTY